MRTPHAALLGAAMRVAVLVPALVACQPAAFPRTAEIAPRGRLAADVALQAVAYEPQQVTLVNGRQLGSSAAFFPIVSGGLRVGVGGCEVGGFYALTRVAGEVRCGLLQERRGAPFSLALGGALGLDYGPVFGAVGRIGLDASVRLGPIRPLVNAYLSTNRALRYVEDHAPETPPIEGPLPPSKSIVRDEVRVTVPLGVAIDLVRAPEGDMEHLSYALIVGATPYHVLHAGPCEECGDVATWTANGGVGFTLGLEIH